MRLAVLMLSLCGLFATGARCDDSAATDTIREFDAFASRYASKSWRPIRPAAAAAMDEIERYFQEIGRDWYAFGDGELARVNAALEPRRAGRAIRHADAAADACHPVPAAERGAVRSGRLRPGKTLAL